MKEGNYRRHRRSLLKMLTGLGGAAIAGKALPGRWTRPAVNAVLLPAHAATSFSGNGTYSTTKTVTMRDEHWLDMLVPRAYADHVTVDHITVCIDVTDNVGTVKVYFKFGAGCSMYTGTISDISSFTDVGLTYSVGDPGITPSGNHISGTAGGSTISGTLFYDSAYTTNFTATLGSACSPTCAPSVP